MGFGHIFTGKTIYDFLKRQSLELQDAVDLLEISSDEDLTEIKQHLFDNHHVTLLEIGTPKADQPYHPVIGPGDRRDKNRIEVKVDIPFIGRKVLFDYQPDPYISVYLDLGYIIKAGDSLGGTITAVVAMTEFDAEIFKSRLNNFLTSISKNIPAINAHLAKWNDSLKNEIDGLLEVKRANSDKMKAFMKEIGLDINADSTNYLVPPIIKKTLIPSPMQKEKSSESTAIPTLASEIYDDILQVIVSAGTSIERKPSLYFQKEEEDLRDIFLLFLETRYENTSGHGEAFNKNGKTDILLRYAPDNSNIFVAECKVWKGKSSLHNAIDQLLTYLTHRDSKTALLFFVNQKKFIPVLSICQAEIKKHPCFVDEYGEATKGSYGYQFSLKGDPEARFRLQLLLFHFD
ncbi:hypothetical protein [Dyadobacter luticola]|uniref:Restriction endonuclease n=1 Tax=Dyadobacter luticola TaxID=1979387 RepID=A0A5R9KW67_9BACT|nr:hypothetical protein [Dyadobacter luticola]TLV00405.1 hypothetical protein FEN17_13010 [Dyadobacter luticola]